ncbi:MAG: PAS domain S-box protein [Desulfobulbaceae bacterium]|nr:PAS domain S-box protein [Desulfobulbaceae bacterium]
MQVKKIPTISTVSLLFFCAWSGLIIISSFFDISQERKKTIEMSKKEALTISNKDIAFRNWVSQHGGVYVPITEKTPPNPCLDHLPERDITTASGKKLTLMNPAYVLRQAMQNYATTHGVQGRLTSLTAINPINEPDPWEQESLKQLHSGAPEIMAIQESSDGRILRIIRALRAETKCLKCHTDSELQAGDVLGGISMRIHLTPYLLKERQAIRSIIATHLIFWAVGTLALLGFTLWSKRRLAERRQALEALQESENNFRSIVENSPTPMLMVDDEGRIISCNKAFKKLFIYSAPAPCGPKKWWEAICNDPVYREKIREEGQAATTNTEITANDSETLTWDIPATKSSPALSVEFKVVRLQKSSIININDITMRKEAEKALQRSERRYKEAQQIAHIGHCELIIPSGELLWSEEIYKIFELDINTVSPAYEHLRHRVHPEDQDMAIMNDFAAGQNTVGKITYRLLFQDKRIKYVQETRRMEYTDEQKPLRFICTIQDITDQKKSEETLLKLEAAIEQTAESIVITDPKGVIQYVNPSFENITGYSSKEVLGNKPNILKSGRHNNEFYKQLWETVDSGQTWQGRFINKKKDGTLFEEDASITPVIDRSGKITCLVAVKRDMTKQIQLEEQLRQAHKMEAIGTLAGGIAHDFNNILTSMLGFTEIALMELPEDHQVHEDLQEVLTAGYRARDLVQQILTFSRRGEQQLSPLRVQLIIKEALKLLRSSLPSTIEIKQDIDNNCPAILADPTQIHQVIINLCTNGYHAMRENGGTLTVKLTLARADLDQIAIGMGLKPGKYCVIEVADTGCGIDPALKERIFEPYFTTKRKGEGTGMGLSMVHGIVQSHGGHINVSSIPEQGSTFRIFLPIPDSIEEIPLFSPREDTSQRGNERILVVDDEESILRYYRNLLGGLGYQVTSSSSSQQALELFRQSPNGFDLVISDMTMPHTTGAELAKKILEERPDTPIILCTGFSELINKEAAQAIGIKDFIQKPFKQNELPIIIRQVLDATTNPADDQS